MIALSAIRARNNADLWAACMAVPQAGLAVEYLAQRGVRLWPLPGAMRWHPALPMVDGAEAGGIVAGAVVAAVTRGDGSLVALHRLWIQRGAAGRLYGRPRALTRPSGSPVGAAIALGAAQDGVIGFATDIESALLARERFGIPTVSASLPKASAVGMWRWPADVQHIVVFEPNLPDRWHRGELQSAVRDLVRRARKAGIRCDIADLAEAGSAWAPRQAAA